MKNKFDASSNKEDSSSTEKNDSTKKMKILNLEMKYLQKVFTVSFVHHYITLSFIS